MSHPPSNPTSLLMRRARAEDSARISVLARLDDKRMPAGPFLLADVAGEIVAAISLSSGIVVADPFQPTADAVAMLRLRATQVPAPVEPAGWRARRAVPARAQPGVA
jgi:hypothetical protein